MNNFEVITFDCYGTLIDWETGIRTAFRKAMEKTGASPDLATKALELYEVEERRVERQTPHLSYRSVLSHTAVAVARKIGWGLAKADSFFLAEELPTWKPFQDTNPALERLARKHKLGILSNIDNDLLAGTLKHLKARFDFLVTAQNVRSYKPALRHFEEARKIIGESPWLHVASSQYHDIEPAHALGIRSAWVNRKNAQLPERFPRDSVREVRDLSQLVDWLSR